MSGSGGGLTASSLTADLNFNWVFLVELLVCAIVTLFFLFYFNRLFATCISYGLRAWTWHRYRVYIDIQALQISFLGGRIFFKGLRYHGNNETILIQSGFLTWRYWLWKVRDVDLSLENVDEKRASNQSSRNGNHGNEPSITTVEEGGVQQPLKIPTRIDVTLKGVEWFIYNRSAAYDSIIAGLLKTADEDAESITMKSVINPYLADGLKRRGKSSDPDNNGAPLNSVNSINLSNYPTFAEKDSQEVQLAAADTFASTATAKSIQRRNVSDPATDGNMILQFLPIHLECTKAAIVVGNENTKSVLIIKFDKFSGEIDATSCKAPDQYRQLFNLDLEHPVIQIKPNDDFKEDQATAASRARRGFEEQLESHTHRHSFIHRYRRKAWHKLQNLVPYFSSSVESFSSNTTDGLENSDSARVNDTSNRWQGLSRYLDEDQQDDKARWSAIEYATVSTILDSPGATLSYYWDIPGYVPAHFRATDSRPLKGRDINGTAAPGWGLDLVFKGAVINYGPWADRQRAELQRVFVPSLCKDSVPGRTLSAGQKRISTIFQVYIQFDGETVVRIPIREESKNWKWKAQADTMGQRIEEQKKQHVKGFRKNKRDKGAPGPEVRPFGWFDMKLAANATVRYSMDMFAGTSGFENKLDLDLPSAEITTSVNHGLLWRSTNQRLSCDLSNPLKWNGLHNWKFDIESNELELFILREHIFLLIDLMEDWSSGPPPDYLTFSPFRYIANLQFGQFKLYMNANDSNIINNPSDFDDNTFLVIFGTAMSVDVCIPIDKFRPHRNDITFDVKASTGGLNLHVPPWNTQATFLTSTELAQLRELKIGGRYQYCATTSASNTDTLLLDVTGKSLEVQLYGFLVGYIMTIKDNYFGNDIRFKTLEEYQHVLQTRQTNTGADLDHAQPHKKSNDLDVILSIGVFNTVALLPANLYSATRNVRIEIAKLDADLRFTNYYMDLDINLSPLVFSLGNKHDGRSTPMSAASSSMLYVDGVHVFGNRLFGLPPSEPTYLCNWDFSVGCVSGECSTEFLNRLFAGIKAFAFTFDDDENALPSISEVPLHDVTFLRVAVERVRIWVDVEELAFLVSMGEINANFNDWADALYSNKLRLQIPDIVLACVNAESGSRQRFRHGHSVQTHAYIKTALGVTMLDRKAGFVEKRLLQQQHIRREDSRTHRTDFLLHDNLLIQVPAEVEATDPPAMCFPRIPTPLRYGKSTTAEDRSSVLTRSSLSLGSQYVRRKSSFLSAASHRKTGQKSPIRRGSSHSVPAIDEYNAGSRSRSRQRSGLPSYLKEARDVSVSTGRQSSFHSAVGEGDEQRATPPSRVSLSTSFIAPYFALDGVEPDAKLLPESTLINFENSKLDRESSEIASLQEKEFDKQAKHTSFLVNLKGGIRAYCDPVALKAVSRLLVAMQPASPGEILDAIQITSMTDIFTTKKQKLLTGAKTDLRLDIPVINVRFANSSAFDSPKSVRREFDQYDLSLLGLSITSRSGTAAELSVAGTEPIKNLALHVHLKSADMSAKERLNNIDNAQAAIHGNVEGFALWMASSDALSGSLDIKSMEVSTNSSKVEYLASLLLRTTLLAADLGDAFTSISVHSSHRLQLFTFLVLTSEQNTSDALFLTRPSYVLRSATDHLRLMDSWKEVTRLRHVFESLDSATQAQISLRSFGSAEICPENAREQVMERYKRWRGWDLHNLPGSTMMRTIFGPYDETSQSTVTTPIRFAATLGLLSFILDPGPKQNEVALRALAASLTTKVPKHVKTRSSEESMRDIQTTILQVYCADISINLNWELCELVENIFTLHNQSGKLSTQSAATNSPTKSTSPIEHHIHIVVATETGSIIVDTINVRALCISKGLKASFFMINRHSDSFTNTNIIVHADDATSKIRSNYQDLVVSQLRQPSIFVSQESQLLNDRVEINWKVAGKCQDLSFVVGQDPIVLLQVADLIIGDEISQIQQLLSKALTGPISKSTTPLQSNHTSVNTIDVALFLDMYHISIPLLQSLRYKISGVIARASLRSRDGSGVIFDFDIKEHAHDIQTRVNDKIKSVSLLQMPPTNGQVTTQIGPKEAVLSIFMSLELVHLDAAAVHSLLAALNRPEISSAILEGRENLRSIERHMTEVLGGNQGLAEQATSNPLRTLVYDAHLTFAGFHMFTNAPGGKDGKQTARLSFNLGSIQVEAANRLQKHGPLLEFPELRIALGQISFGLSRITPKGMDPCGNFTFGAYLTASSDLLADGSEIRSFRLKSDSLEINLFAATASTVLHVLGYFQDQIKDLDLSREVQYLQKLRKPNPRIIIQDGDSVTPDVMPESTNLFASKYSVELLDISVSWIVGMSTSNDLGTEDENLVLSLKRFDLSTKKENSAKLTIEDLQLQIVPATQDKRHRSPNSALLPEVIFNVGYVSTNEARRLAFQAAGKSLDLRLTSQCIIPASGLKKSIESALEQVRVATSAWIVPSTAESTNETKRAPFFGTKRMESLLIDADFGGAVVQLQGKRASDSRGRTGRAPQSGKYGQFSQDDPSSTTMLRAPGLAWKIEFKDDGIDDPSLNGEIKVDASTNILFPTVVPLILEVSSAIQSLVSDEEHPNLEPKSSPQKYLKADEENILTTDPSAMLGQTRLNLGLRICAQEFSLSCQPIARVSATARFDDIYITFNTVRSIEHGNFFAISAAFNRFQTSVQHVYSRDSTGSFEVDSIVLSLMNSKHVSGKSGVSAILKISPMKVLVNAKQLQDFLLFREIWIPPEIRSTSNAPNQVNPTVSSQSFSVQRYQEVAATGAFPWNATMSIAELDVQLDLGQSIGKSAFMISNFWVSSKKNSDWEQNLCFGFDEVAVNSSGRMSGFVALQKFRVRTSIQWPQREKALNQTPLVQGSLSFSQFRVKAAFDYQAFLVADITSVDYLMYNVRRAGNGQGDRLVAVLDGDSVQVFCTTTTASQAIALYQAMLRLAQEKRSNYEASLREIERFMKRKSVANIGAIRSDLSQISDEKGTKSPISLQTDVVVTLKSVNMGVFPSTFFDNQVFKLEALNAEAKFAVRMEQGKIRSGLGLTLGQLRIGLAGVKSPAFPKPSGDLSVDEVVASATGSRGGTILKVPKVEAFMETWQVPNSNHIDYVFKSSFEGKVEVGWNYSRISYIRGMYGNHSRALAQRLGKPLAPSAVKITGVPDGDSKDRVAGEQQKITAEVMVPQSKYEYFAIEPPIIETPQLRDMGEATPPLEWIGLHRDRLPNLTHQIVIVTLLELATEVEEAYEKILGSS